MEKRNPLSIPVYHIDGTTGEVVPHVCDGEQQYAELESPFHADDWMYEPTNKVAHTIIFSTTLHKQ